MEEKSSKECPRMKKSSFFRWWDFPRSKKSDCRVQINLHGVEFQVLLTIGNLYCPIYPFFTFKYLHSKVQTEGKSSKKCPWTKKSSLFRSWEFPRTLQSSFSLHTQVVWLRKLNIFDHYEVVWNCNCRLFVHHEVVWNCHFWLKLNKDSERSLE